MMGKRGGGEEAERRRRAYRINGPI